MVILDTNILIEIYRGNSAIMQAIQNINSQVVYVSSVSAAEFLVGAKDKADYRRIEKQLAVYNIVNITSEISEIFLDLFKQFSLSHRPGIADTLIAATALYYQIPVFTLNKRHFQFIPGLSLH